ncbi:hypothetical protein [Microbacterium sp. NC79]|nr:hypothetical protein [Microbacterium sp. NC79]MBV0894001.1 hypothetical protein [Microbacterium sp. NC79]
MLILDRHRAAAWTMARLLQNLLWDIDDGNPTVSPSMIAVDTALARY